MKRLLASAAVAAMFAASPAFAQPPSDTQEVAPADTSASDIPAPQTSVTIDTAVHETPDATVETTVATVAPVQQAAIDPENPIAPEVQAVVDSKKHYTTADLVAAQHQAMLNTPASVPTTTTTTVTTTPRPGR